MGEQQQDDERTSSSGSDNSESGSGSDSDEEELPEEYRKPMAQMARMRQSVSAEAYGEWNKQKAFAAPVIPKTEDQRKRLKECLTRSFLFHSLESRDLSVVIGAMREEPVQSDECIIQQGDDGDCLY